MVGSVHNSVNPANQCLPEFGRGRTVLPLPGDNARLPHRHPEADLPDRAPPCMHSANLWA